MPAKRHVHLGILLTEPRLPLLYGSARVVVCAKCGKWHDSRDFRAKWREAFELLIAIAEDQREKAVAIVRGT